ncbi:MAG: class I SAM-dependent methyltransferase [Methylovirgula sp.]
MTKSEQSVAQHYTHGSLERTILAALAASGKDLENLTPADLAPVDEFHIGGREATVDFAAQLELKPGLEILDIGSGLGGASRYFAHECGCRVTGVDLTQEFVSTAELLARRVRLENCVSYRQGSALALPFAAGSFDVAYMLHVGMNIEDKASLFAEVRRTLEPGGIFGIYDVMRDSGEGDLRFPVPWATHPDMSFVETPATYWRLLEGAGFAVLAERSRRAFAVEFFEKMRARAVQDTVTPPLGLHILMGASAPQKAANMIENLELGLIVPVEIIARAV